uniref:Ribonuclease H-like domain-containing protein n=1 Tax=Tanacetum cinerariifolium TaxID=118510 RepID=A0A699IHJ4_TANCI|nr:ribonuclease H-like domain-containing protein [Tanacetum cinerariifolium]
MTRDGSSGSDLSLQLANLLKNGLNQQPQNPKLSDNLQINLKLNSQNYALWTRMIRVAIGGKSKSLLSHLTTDPPDQTSEDYEQWEKEDLIVFSWLIQNIKHALAGNLTEYPTAKMLWDALAVTYSSGRDKLQTFNLQVKANDIKQNNSSLEDFWISLQGVWGEIDRIDPNLMKCPEDIKTYSKIRSEQKLFQFLNALDRRYEPIKREILRLEPLPSAEAAYATVRKEAAHQNILGATIIETQGIATDFATSTKPTKSYIDTTNGENDGSDHWAWHSNKRVVLRGSQGESECLDTLNWLKYVACGDRRSHDTADESHLSTQPDDHVNVTQTAPNLIPEVSNPSPISNPIETNASWQEGNVHEQEMFFNQDDTPSELNEHVQEQEKSSTQEETSERYVLPPRANRGVPPKRYSPEKVSRGSKYPMANIAKGNLSKEAKAFVASVYSDEIPANTKQALKSIKWKNAMEEEMKLSQKTTHGKMCLATWKENCRVSVANKGWPLHQFDVKNAFLHGELKKEVYMEAPHGFTNKFGEREVCLLKKSLYGLKQSPRAWFGRFTLAMKNYSFKQSNSDHTLFLKQRGNLITCLIIYVDDMIVTGDDKEEITKLKKYLFTEFEMKDLGRLKYFLRIEVLRSKQGIFMCQKRYILDLLAETGMIDCKPADTPMIVNQKLHMEEKAELANKGKYQ